jgi:MSHA biogenesis protein MshO
VTLIEMVIAIVLVGIIVAATVFFANPLRQAVDTTARAALTDTADNTLQRIGREVRLALPNSVRVKSSGGSVFIEFIPVRTAGRYRTEASGPCPGGGTDELLFDASDNCFRTIGEMPDANTVVANDFLVFNNYGDGFDGQNAYSASTPNRRKITAFADEASHDAITFDSSVGTLSRTSHDSPGKRFFIVPGNGGAPAPVTFECTPPKVVRWSGYTLTESQSTSFPGGTPALLADNVSSCAFDYQASGVGPRIGLLTLQITLSKALSSGTPETVALYHAVHVNNVP